MKKLDSTMVVRVLYGSETGTAQDVAEQIWKSAKRFCYCSFGINPLLLLLLVIFILHTFPLRLINNYEKRIDILNGIASKHSSVLIFLFILICFLILLFFFIPINIKL